LELLKFFLQTGIVGKVVLLILALMSLQSWAYIIFNLFLYRKIGGHLKKAEELLKVEPSLSGLIREIKSDPKNFIFQDFRKFILWFDELYERYFGGEIGKGEEKAAKLSLIDRDLEEKIYIEREEFSLALGKGLGFLATTGNVAPFIGLFGTVWGIMKAFHAIGLKGSASLATVAPGIAEALINTAMGLFCAIPAVIAYNYFTLKKEGLAKRVELSYKRLTLILKKNVKV
jgi:biopolymer transport protein TolQ